MQLRGTMLLVKDFPRMRDFYAKVFGSQPVNTEWTDSYAVFELDGGGDFALHAIPAEFAKGIEISSPPVAREKNPWKVIFEVEDVAEELERLEELGVTLLPRPWQDPEESCDACDLEGNVFQIVKHGGEGG
jgi:predicted enzyme related to lactoylglutathione lyase